MKKTRYAKLCEMLSVPQKRLVMALSRINSEEDVSEATACINMAYWFTIHVQSPLIARRSVQKEASRLLATEPHGSAMWRLMICLASGKITQEDLELLFDIVKPQDAAGSKNQDAWGASYF